jgi:hypothetical protein
MAITERPGFGLIVGDCHAYTGANACSTFKGTYWEIA